MTWSLFLKEGWKAIKQEWAKMTTSDKVKIAARVLCSIGASSIGGVCARKYIESEDPGKFETAAVVTTAIGLSWAASDIAYNAWSKMIDNYVELKNAKDSVNDLGDENEHEEVVG